MSKGNMSRGFRCTSSSFNQFRAKDDDLNTESSTEQVFWMWFICILTFYSRVMSTYISQWAIIWVNVYELPYVYLDLYLDGRISRKPVEDESQTSAASGFVELDGSQKNPSSDVLTVKDHEILGQKRQNDITVALPGAAAPNLNTASTPCRPHQWSREYFFECHYVCGGLFYQIKWINSSLFIKICSLTRVNASYRVDRMQHNNVLCDTLVISSKQ